MSLQPVNSDTKHPAVEPARSQRAQAAKELAAEHRARARAQREEKSSSGAHSLLSIARFFMRVGLPQEIEF